VAATFYQGEGHPPIVRTGSIPTLDRQQQMRIGARWDTEFSKGTTIFGSAIRRIRPASGGFLAPRADFMVDPEDFTGEAEDKGALPGFQTVIIPMYILIIFTGIIILACSY